MGKSITPKYAARYRDQQGWHDIDWKGRATDAAAERKRQALNESFNVGGCNWHVSEAAGIVIHVSALEVRRNVPGGHVVASAKAPMFEVV